MNILAFAGSSSRKSINRQVLQSLSPYFENHQYDLLDLNDYALPLFDVDIESVIGVPANAKAIAEQIDLTDLLIISLAEHNGAYSAAFKNLFDWISRIKGRKAFGDKPIFLMAVSDGARGGKSVLEIAEKRMPFSGGKVLETFSFPLFYENFDPENGITNPELKAALEEKIKAALAKVDQ